VFVLKYVSNALDGGSGEEDGNFALQPLHGGLVLLLVVVVVVLVLPPVVLLVEILVVVLVVLLRRQMQAWRWRRPMVLAKDDGARKGHGHIVLVPLIRIILPICTTSTTPTTLLTLTAIRLAETGIKYYVRYKLNAVPTVLQFFRPKGGFKK